VGSFYLYGKAKKSSFGLNRCFKVSLFFSNPCQRKSIFKRSYVLNIFFPSSNQVEWGGKIASVVHEAEELVPEDWGRHHKA